MKRSLPLSILLFTLAFWLWRIPFILWFPLPEFSPDTFDYFSVVRAMLNRTTLEYPVDMPLGFPITAYLISLLSSKVVTIIWLQFILKFLSGLLLIYAFYKYSKWIAIPISILLCIYITDSWSLRYDTALIPDSLYNSFLLCSVAFTVLVFQSATPLRLFSLSVSMFLMALARSNGLFIYFLIPFVFLLLFQNKQPYWKYLLLAVPVMLLHPMMIYFKNNSGILRPTNDRLVSVISRETDFLKKGSSTYARAKLLQVKKYFKMEEFPSFYFSLLTERHRHMYELDIINDPDYKMFDWKVPVPDDLRRLVYREYLNQPAVLKNNRYRLDISNAYSNPLFVLIHLTYKIQNLFFRNFLWYASGLLVLIFGCWRFVKSSWRDKSAFLVILLLLIHFLNVLAVTYGHDRFIPRYAYMTEFLLYFSPFFLLLLTIFKPEESKN